MSEKITQKTNGSKTVHKGGRIVGNLPNDAVRQGPTPVANAPVPPPRRMDFQSRYELRSSLSLTSLIYDLTVSRGTSWQTLSEISGVPIEQVKRLGVDPNLSCDRQNLVRFAALIDVLEHETPNRNALRWMEQKLDLPANKTSVRPLDLFLDGYDSDLIGVAKNEATAAKIISAD